MLAGCAKHEAEEAVKRLLNDPDSAQFSKVTTSSGGNVCGLVNARNRMGGYVGATPFYYRRDMQMAAIVSAPDDSDFRSLWLAVKLNSGTDNEFMRLTMRCQLVADWKTDCGTDYPGETHKMCGAMLGDGAALFDKLKAAYQ
jgi:hypothetical protein